MQFTRLIVNLNVFAGFGVVRNFPRYDGWNSGIETVMVDYNQ